MTIKITTTPLQEKVNIATSTIVGNIKQLYPILKENMNYDHALSTGYRLLTVLGVFCIFISPKGILCIYFPFHAFVGFLLNQLHMPLYDSMVMCILL